MKTCETCLGDGDTGAGTCPVCLGSGFVDEDAWWNERGEFQESGWADELARLRAKEGRDVVVDDGINDPWPAFQLYVELPPMTTPFYLVRNSEGILKLVPGVWVTEV